VTVNGAGAALYGDRTFAKDGFTVTNGQNSFTAIATDSYGRADTNTISANLPATNTFAHDLNGNLTNWNGRSFEYDDENQLTRVTQPGEWKSEFTYDGKMRLRIRKEYAWSSGSWLLTAESRYVYDGMLCVQERDGQNFPVQTHTRGRDLSGSLQGAGGIGGLLAMTENSYLTPHHSYFHADGNGNVTALINAIGVIAGRYSYDPYGNTLSLSGTKALVNRFRFSSKEHHSQSGLYYYGYRFYVPELQRWLNRDPIGERGGRNLYAFCKSNPISNFDIDGRILPILPWITDKLCKKVISPVSVGGPYTFGPCHYAGTSTSSDGSEVCVWLCIAPHYSDEIGHLETYTTSVPPCGPCAPPTTNAWGDPLPNCPEIVPPTDGSEYE
jgi:RHS repeat-associated protein